MNEALHDNDAAAALLGGFNNGIQRAESSAWRRNRAGGAAITRSLQTRINQLTSAVHLVQPAVGTYSLSSVDSPVVVTVSNELPRAVTVQVSVSPANGVVGFRAPPVQQQTIPARSIATIRIPTHVDRLGKFQVVALLRTPDGRQLGPGVTLNLRATSIGSVTKVITVVAVSVLVLALLRRADPADPAQPGSGRRRGRVMSPPVSGRFASWPGEPAMTEDGWSPQRLYGTPLPLPGDASGLAVETAQPVTGDAWSAADLPRPAPAPAPLVRAPAAGSPAARAPWSGRARTAPGQRDPGQRDPERRGPDGTRQAVRPRHPPAVRPPTKPPAPSLLASSRTMAIASMVSRVTGLLRNIVIARRGGRRHLQRRRRLRPGQHAAQHGLRAAARRGAHQRHHPGAGQGPAGRRRPRGGLHPAAAVHRHRRAGRCHPARGAGGPLADRHLRRAAAVPVGGRAVGHPAAAGDLLLRPRAR